MGAVKKRNITQLQTSYVKKQAEAEMNVGRKRKRLYRRLTAFFIIAAAMSFFMISTILSQTSTLADKVIEKEKYTNQLAKLQQEEAILEEEIMKLNDDEYIAKLARKEYFLSENNEIIFSLPNKKEKTESEGKSSD
ncbi:septum formation initiator family protein [Bacillus sp. Bva_UNVM-123]|uniref:FtsB family cell division protein n=1 Tax=Bacillus sp. Bva_UNVM-123 TaxID=2829798 RepID=UPI00391FBB02